MKLVLKDITIIILLTIIFLQTCGKKPPVPIKSSEVVKHVVDTQYIPQTQIIYKKGEDIPVKVYIYDTIFKDVDTVAVLRDYFAQRVYNDTLKFKYGNLFLRDTVNRNQILARQFKTDFRIPTIRETITVREAPKVQMYLGFSAAFNLRGTLGFFGPKVFIKSKKDQLYWLGAGLGVGGNPQVSLGTAWKIKL